MPCGLALSFSIEWFGVECCLDSMWYVYLLEGFRDNMAYVFDKTSLAYVWNSPDNISEHNGDAHDHMCGICATSHGGSLPCGETFILLLIYFLLMTAVGRL